MRPILRTGVAALLAMSALAMVVSAPAFASGAPFVETKRDTGVGETKATLNGVVNPNGAETKYYFEYGNTTSYGSKTAETSAGSGTSNLEESKTLTGLTPHRTYHYRVVATNSNGTTHGADEVFYTTATALPEFKPVPTKKKLTGTSGTVIFALPTTSISCSKSTAAGEITSASAASKLVITFTGCKVTAGTCEAAVTSLGAKEGEIITKPLLGELGTVNTKEATSGVGLLLEAETKNTAIATFAASACLGEGKWYGNVAGEVTPIGKKQLTSKFVFKGTGASENINEIIVKRGAVTPELEESWFGGIFSMTATDEATFEEALEVT